MDSGGWFARDDIRSIAPASKPARTVHLSNRISERRGKSVKILVVGGGAREHALCWKLAQSPLVSELLCTPGNPGTNEIARNLPFKANDIHSIVNAVQELEIDLVIVGPEEPLSLGLADEMAKLGVPCFGPSKAAAQIETSKQWAKAIMAAGNVPTGRSVAATEMEEALAALDCIRIAGRHQGRWSGGRKRRCRRTDAHGSSRRARIVSDRPRAGRGRGALSHRRVSRRLRAFRLRTVRWQDHTLLLSYACDYKRAYDGDAGPNTGGMGAMPLQRSLRLSCSKPSCAPS